MSYCCDGHSLCDKCQARKIETMERMEGTYRRPRHRDSMAAMMRRLGGNAHDARNDEGRA
jgi:hypothetical protein